MKDYIELMRPKHYIKNLLILFPLIFSGNLFHGNLLGKSILSFIAFSLVTSFVYIINDVKDCEKDKLHEKKKNRPIASGRIKKSRAIVLAIVILIIAFVILFLAIGTTSYASYLYVLVYIFINLLYSFGLKNVPILDVAILVAGFLIRVLFGASIIGIDVSHWLYLTIMALAFYLGFGKRRNEIKKQGKDTRKVLAYYNVEFLDKNMYMCLSLAIIFYALWTVDSNIKYLVWTVPIIILILMKYSMDVENDSLGDPVDVIYSDKLLVGIIFLYGIILMGIIYLL